jgi:hypothetical protein
MLRDRNVTALWVMLWALGKPLRVRSPKVYDASQVFVTIDGVPMDLGPHRLSIDFSPEHR